MKTLSPSTFHVISAGCGELTAKEAYIAYLKVCTVEDRQNVFNIRKNVFKSFFGQESVDEETVRQALITAFENASF